MSEAGYVPVQFGMTAGADFEANTMTLEMEPGYVVSVGPVAVLPRHTYEELIEALSSLSDNIDRTDYGHFSLDSREGFDAETFIENVRDLLGRI